MTLKTNPQSSQLLNDAALSVIGSLSRESQQDINSKLNQHTNVPLRLYVDTTTNTTLTVGSSTVTMGDGASKVMPPIDDVQNTFTSATLDVSSGAAVNFEKDGVAMATIPTPVSFSAGATANGSLYARVALAYDAANNKINTHWDTNATYSSLANPGAMFALFEGVPLGYLNLVNIQTGTKWASYSAGTTAPTLVNADLVRYGSGSGVGGGGADKAFKLQITSFPTATIKGGYMLLSDGRILATGTGTTTATVGKDISIDVTVLTRKDVTTLTSDTNYTIYVDLNSLGSAVTLTDNGRKVYTVAQANLVISPTVPEAIDARRYVYLDDFNYGGGTLARTVNQRPTRSHDLLGGQLPVQTYTSSITSTATPFLHTLTHNFAGTPHTVDVFYNDGTKTFALEPSSYIVDVTSTYIKVSTQGLTIAAGTPMIVKAIYVPTQTAYFGSSRTFSSGWYTTTAITTVAHGLTDREDIRGYEVQEWNTTTDRVRNIDRALLVTNFNDTNFYLSWGSLTPSETLKYRVVAGGSPLPYAIPSPLVADYTKSVGTGGYATLTAALAAAGAGDHILVTKDTTVAADVVVSASDIKITFMPGIKLLFDGTVTNAALSITGNRVTVTDAHVQITGSTTATVAAGIKISGIDAYVHNARVELNVASKTLTSAYLISSGATRAYLKGSAYLTAGTAITDALTDSDGGGDVFVRG